MANSAEHQPTFLLAEGFTLPADLSDEEVAAANAAFGLEHYTSGLLIASDVRERLFGTAESPGLIGPYSCNGFVLHNFVRVDSVPGKVGIETIIAPSPGMDQASFLEMCLGLSHIAMPGDDFNESAPRLRDVADVLAREGLKAATGVRIGIKDDDPSQSFGSLVVPRVFVSEFGARQSEDPPEIYATKLSGVLFGYATTLRLEDLRSEE